MRGCDPKKVLVGAAEIIERSMKLKKRGIAKTPTINWSELMRFKNSFTGPLPKSNEKWFKKIGIDSYHGHTTFIAKNTVKIGKKELEGKHIVIATGATPRKLNIDGEKYVTNSDRFLELKKLPKDITFIGGGFISFELGHIAARAGANVRILQRDDRPLGQFDPDLVKMLVKEFRGTGVNIVLNAPVKSVEKKGRKLVVHAGKRKIKTDMVVHGAGRVPNIASLNLEKAGVKYEKRGITVNDYLQTSNPTIYAGGDSAAAGLPLTPIAALHGNVIATNLLKKNKTKVDHTATASVVFTFPPLAAVGLTEEQAKKKGIKFNTNFADTSSWYNPKRIGLTYSGYKILIDTKGYIIGAHLLYPNSDDVINIFVLAMKNRIKAEDLKKYLWSYPSNSYDIRFMVP